MPNLVTCPCQHCNGKIQFDPEELSDENKSIPCPHCSMETTLFVPPLEPVEPPPPPPPPQQRISQPNIFITTTGNEISGRTIENYLGIARGVVVRSPKGSE